MESSEVVVFIFLLLISISAFTVSVVQLKEKGILFNNAYLYASKQQRADMNKKPYYKQSGIIFIFIGLIFLLNTFQILLDSSWLFWLSMVVALVTIVYAIISSIQIERNKH